MREVDICVIGGGIAGLSLAARCAAHGATLVLEAESLPGYHSSGRSVAFAHYGLGNPAVRALTALSMEALAAPGQDGRAPAASIHPALHIASAHEIAQLDALEDIHALYKCDYARISAAEAREFLPVLKTGPDHCAEALIDHGSLKLDADAMLQNALRELRARGGELVSDARVAAIRREGERWVIEAGNTSVRARQIVNAAGAWADVIAAMAGAQPIGLEPRRRTVISFAGPAGVDVLRWPFVKTVGEGFYMLPEGTGRLLASPMDQTPTAPCDAAPEELDVATIAHRIEQASELTISRIEHSWAGLRSFAGDELPVVGYDEACPAFFWFAGQGGAGLQIAPALAEIGEALLFGLEWRSEWSEVGLAPAQFAPARLRA